MAEVKDPIKRKKLYDYLSQNNMTDLSFQDFSIEYSSKSEKQENLYSYLSKEGMTDLSKDEFSKEYFGDLKKKVNTDLVSTSQKEDTASTTSQKQPSISLDLSEKNDEFEFDKAPELQDVVKQQAQNILKDFEVPKEKREELTQLAQQRIEEFKKPEDDSFSAQATQFMGQVADYISGAEFFSGGFTKTKEEEYDDVISAYEQAEKQLVDLKVNPQDPEYQNKLDEKAKENLANTNILELKELKAQEVFEDMDEGVQDEVFGFVGQEYLQNNKDLRKDQGVYKILEKDFIDLRSKHESDLSEYSSITKEQEIVNKLSKDADEEKVLNYFKEKGIEVERENAIPLLKEQYINRLERMTELLPKLQNDAETLDGLNNQLDKKRDSILDAHEANLTFEENLDLLKKNYDEFDNLKANAVVALGKLGQIPEASMLGVTDLQKSILDILPDTPYTSAIDAGLSVTEEKLQEGLLEKLDYEQRYQELFTDYKLSDANDVSDVFYAGGKAVAGNWVSLAMGITGGSAAPYLFGASGFSSKRGEIAMKQDKDETFNPSHIEKFTASTISGASEFVFGKLGTLQNIKIAKRTIKNAGKATSIYESPLGYAKNVFRDVSKGFVNEAFKEELPIAFIDAANNYVLLDDDNAFKEFKKQTGQIIFDSGFVGGSTTLAPHTVGITHRVYGSIASKSRIRKNSKKITELVQALSNKDLSDENRQFINEEIVGLVDDNYDMVEQELLSLNNLSEKERNRVADIYANLKELRVKSGKIKAEKGVSDNTKKQLVDKLREKAQILLNEREDLIEKAKKGDEQIQPEQEAEQTQPEETVEEAIFGDDELAELQKQIEEDEIKQQQEKDAQEKINKEKEKEGTISQNLNEKAYMNGKEGMIKILDSNKNTVVFETNDEIIDLGRKDEIENSFISDLGLSTMPPEGVNVTKLDSDTDIISVDGIDYTFVGRRRDKKGKAVVRVKEVESGLERRFVGEKAERILKDQSLKKPKNKPTIKLNQEGKKIPDAPKETKAEKRKKAVQAKEEADVEEEIILEEELKKRTEKAEKDVKEFEEMLLEDAVSESADKDLVQYKGNIFQVTKKKDGSFAVSQMRDDGKLVAVFESNPNRNKAIGIFKSKKTNVEKKALSEAENLISEYRKEQEDKILNWLEGVRNEVKKANKNQLNAIGLIPYAAEKALDLVITAYKGGKTMAEAIKIGYEYAKKQNNKITELDFKKFVLQQSKAPKQVKQQTQPPKQVKQTTQAPKKSDSKKDKKRLKQVESKAKRAKAQFKSNNRGIFKPDEGEFIKAMSLNPSKLTEEDLNEYEELLDKVAKDSFSQLRNKDAIDKFAKISDEQSAGKTKPKSKPKKEKDKADVNTISEFQKLQKQSLKDVSPDNLGLAMNIKRLTKDELEAFTQEELEALASDFQDILAGDSSQKKTIDELTKKVKPRRNLKEFKEETEGKGLRRLRSRYITTPIEVIMKKLSGKGVDKRRLFQQELKKYLRTGLLGNVDNILKGKKTGILEKVLGGLALKQGYERASFDNKSGINVKASSKHFSKKAQRELRKKKETGNIALKSNVRIAAVMYDIAFKENRNADGTLMKGVASAKDYVDATVKKIREENGNPKRDNKAGKATMTLNKVLNIRDDAQDILDAYEALPKNADGTIDTEKVFDEVFTESEKETYDMIFDYLQNEGKERALAVAAMEGKTSLMYKVYVPTFTSGNEKYDIAKSEEMAKQSFADGLSLSEFGNLIEKDNKVHALDFNFVQRFSRMVESLNREYHLRPAINEHNATIKLISRDKDIESDFKDLAKAYSEVMQDVYSQTVAGAIVGDLSYVNDIARYLREIGYMAALSDPARTALETATNALHAGVFDGKSLVSGLNYGAKVNDAPFLMYFTGATQLVRGFLDNSSVYRDVELYQQGSKKAYGNNLQNFVSWGRKINKNLVSAQDRVLLKPFWMGSFLTKYKELTGEDIDVDRIKTDNDYADSVYDNALKAANFANDNTLQMSSTTNAMEGVPATQLSAKESGNILKSFNRYMNSFMLAEWSSMVKAYDAVRGDRSDMSRGKGMKLLTATILRMFGYNIGMAGIGIGYNALFGLLGQQLSYEKDEEEEDFETIAKREGIATIASTLGRRRLGNIPYAALSMAYEMGNIKYGEGVTRRDGGKYDYGDAIAFSYIPLNPKTGNLSTQPMKYWKGLANVSGAYKPLLDTGVGIISSWSGSQDLKTKKGRENAEKRFYRQLMKAVYLGLQIPAPRTMNKFTMLEEIDKPKKLSPIERRNLIEGMENFFETDMKDIDFPDAKFPEFDF